MSNDQAKGFLNNIIASATWDGVKRGVGCSLVTGLATAVWEKLKRGSLDWAAIGGMFALTLLVVLSIFRKKEPAAASVDGILAGLPKQTPEGKQQQGKPAWQKLQWCNAERERLEKEVDQLKAERSGLRAAFTNPKWEVVQGHNFVNTSIEIDGKAFRQCRFENVTFIFHGKAPVEFTSDNQFTGNKLRFDTDDPAVMAFMQLRMIVEKIPGASIVTGALDAKGNVMPDNFHISVPPVAVSEAPPLRYPIPQLRLKMLAMVSALQGFLGEHGDEPVVSRLTGESTSERALRYFNEVNPWKAKFIGDYRLRFGGPIPKLRDEMRVRASISDNELNEAIEAASNNEEGSCRAVKSIVDRLWALGRNMNA